MGNSWAFSDSANLATRFDNVKKTFDERYVKRLEHVQIFCRDALNVLENCNSEDAFHFIDPPYYNADMGHYEGYKEDDFRALLDLLQTIKGKFLLITYPSGLLTQYTAKNGWHTIENIYLLMYYV